MRIFLFAHIYPLPYKPYYDTQFADLVEQGHDVTIFAGEPGPHKLNERVRDYGLDQRVIHVPTTLGTVPSRLGEIAGAVARDPGLAPRAWRAASGTARRTRTRASSWARAVTVAGTRTPPDVCFVHGLGTAVMFPWLKELFPDATVAMYYHGGEVPSVPDLSDALAARVFSRFDVVFTNTEFSRQHAIGRGCAPERVRILPVGFWLSDFELGQVKAYRDGGTLRLLSAGRMSEEKGHIFALQALRALVERGMKDVHYAMTGEGYVRPQLEEYVEEHGLEPWVTFLGQVSTEELLEEMRRADVLLLPSIQVGNWVENQACAVQEAMLMEALVVTSRTGGVPESIPEAMRPLSVPESDPHALTEVLERVYRMTPEEMAGLGKEGRRFVEDNYDIRELNRRLVGTIAATQQA